MVDVLDKVATFYDDAIGRNGPSAQGVNWSDAEKHGLRFAYLAEVLKDERDPISIADVGCGYGALYDHFARWGFEIAEYTGYDIAPAMVRAGRERLGAAPGVSFAQSATIDRDVDYAFVSGTFNVRLGQNETQWRAMIERTLDNMNECSRKGFAFNAMTTRVDWRDDNLFYADPGEFLHRCLDLYSRNVRLLHDMPLYEWTMLVFKG